MTFFLYYSFIYSINLPPISPISLKLGLQTSTTPGNGRCGRQHFKMILKIPGSCCTYSFSQLFNQQLVQRLLGMDFASIIQIVNQLILKQRDYLGGANLITWVFKGKDFFLAVAEEEVRETGSGWLGRKQPSKHPCGELPIDHVARNCQWAQKLKAAPRSQLKGKMKTSVLQKQGNEFYQHPV